MQIPIACPSTLLDFLAPIHHALLSVVLVSSLWLPYGLQWDGWYCTATVRPIAYVYHTYHTAHTYSCTLFNPVASFTSTLFFQRSTWLDSSIIPIPVECREEGQSTGDSPSFCRLLQATFPCKPPCLPTAPSEHENSSICRELHTWYYCVIVMAFCVNIILQELP